MRRQSKKEGKPKNFIDVQTNKFYRRTNQKQKRQLGGFPNRYDFANAGRDTVNQAAKVAP